MNSDPSSPRNPRSLSPSDVGLDGRFSPRTVCYQCMRPTEHCYCDVLPQIDNRTEVIVLQHRRESVHPFNTARMVDNSLIKSRLIVGHVDGFTPDRLRIPADAGLLFPGPNSRSLDELSVAKLPKCLVVIDGTWDHANRMFKDIPALQKLPQYKLKPCEPGNYRIRVEPTATALSTVEAIVAALQIIEPNTVKLGELLSAFETMVDRQLAHPLAADKYSNGDETPQYTLNIPKSLCGDLSNIVVAYGEAEPKLNGPQSRNVSRQRLPVYWVAQRMDTGKIFEETIDYGGELSSQILTNLQLSPSDFAEAIAPEEFAKRWQSFCRPADVIVVPQTSAMYLLAAAGVGPQNFDPLKAINIDPEKQFTSRAEYFGANGVSIEPQRVKGRAGKRLASQVTLVKHLNRLRAGS